MTGFAIFDLPVLQGRLGLCPLPGRDSPYEPDLRALLDWSPDLVLSMTTAQEMAKAGAGALAEELRAASVQWHHLPIADFGLPDPVTHRAWLDIAPGCQASLGQGGRVLVHCHGGCGRSGMICLRMMQDAGEAPDTALQRLRAIRPCAVETAAQLAWANTRT